MSREDRSMLFKTVDFARVVRLAAGGDVDVIVRAKDRATYHRLHAAFQAMTQEALDWFPECQGEMTAIDIEGVRVGIMLEDGQ